MAKKQAVSVDYSRVEQQVWQLAEPLAAQAGAELIDVEYVKEAGQWYLRLFIDREPPVDLDLCEQVSNLVSPALDKNDPVDESYLLEVSSPGIERPLRREQDFARYAGADVVVKLYAPQDGIKQFEGQLIGLEAGTVLIDYQGEEKRFLLDQVAKVHLKADI